MLDIKNKTKNSNYLAVFCSNYFTTEPWAESYGWLPHLTLPEDLRHLRDVCWLSFWCQDVDVDVGVDVDVDVDVDVGVDAELELVLIPPHLLAMLQAEKEAD